MLKREQFVFFFILYAVISTMLFIHTSGGWSTVYAILFFPLLYSVILLFGLIYLFSKRTTHVFGKMILDKKVLLVLLIVQGGALLLNRGDCGDGGSGPNTYFFLERLLAEGGRVCSRTKVSTLSNFSEFALLGFVILICIYVVTLVYFCVSAVKSK